MTARTLTIVFTDIKGFTERTSRASRAEMLRMLDQHERVLLPIVRHYGGKVIKTIGDAFLLAFESPTNAVLCGLMMQEALRAHNKGKPADDRIEIRVAINTGEVELIGNDVFGETVNVASRIEGIADAGDVYFAESTYLAMHKAEVPTSEVGTFRLKGIPEEVRVYQVVFDEDLDLFQKVVSAQDVDGEAQADGDGQFSKALLYSIEQEQALSVPNYTGRWVFAAAVMVVAVAGTWMAWGTLQYRGDRARVADLIEAGRTQAAIEVIEALRSDHPTDVRLSELLGEAVAKDVQIMRDAKRYDEAMERLTASREAFPFLEVHDELERLVRIDQAEATFVANRKTGQDAFEALLAEWPDDREIKYRVAMAHITWGGRWDVPLAHFLDLVEADPDRYRDDENVRATILKYAADTNWTSLAEVVAEHYFADPEFKKMLLANLYASGPDNAEGRRLAHAVVTRADPEAIDEGRYMAVELLGRGGSDSFRLDEVVAYWEAALAAGTVEDQLPAAMPEPVVLRSPGSHITEQVLPVVEAAFAEPLKPFLMARLDSVEDRGYRVFAYRFGKERGWFDESDEVRHHEASIEDYESGRWLPHVAESVAWFEAHPEHLSPQLRPQLEHIRDDMGRTWERWGGEGVGGNDRHAALRDAAARVLGKI